MTAKEARAMTLASLGGSVIAPYLDHIYARVAGATKAGKSLIVHPWMGLKIGTPYPSQIIEDAVWRHLVAEEYVIRHLPDPDPEDQRSCAYTEIRW